MACRAAAILAAATHSRGELARNDQKMEQLLDDDDLEFFQELDDAEDAMMDTNDVPLVCTKACTTESQDDVDTQCPEGQWDTHLQCIPITSLPAHLGMGRRLQRILSRRDPNPSKYPGPVVELFGCAFLLTHSAGLEMWNKLFMLARKELMFLEEMGQDLPSPDFRDRTAGVLAFVDTVECFVYRYMHTPASSAATHSTQATPSVDHLSACVRLLLANLSPLEEYLSESVGPLHSVLARNYTQESLLALHLHIRRGLLSLLFAAGSSMQSLLCDCLQQVLEELLCVGAAVFHSCEKKSAGGSGSVLPCRYECVLELWLVVVRMCDRMADEGTGKAFWKTLSQVMSSVAHETSEDEPTTSGPLSSTEAPLSGTFWWRMVEWLAQLYCYDSSGSLTPSAQGMHAEDWQLVHELLLPMNFREDCPRDALSSSLASLGRLCVLWSPNLDVVLLFWPAVKKTMYDSPLPKPGRFTSPAEDIFASPQEVVSFVALLCDGKGGRAGDHSVFLQYTALLCGLQTKLSSSAWKRVDEAILSTLQNEDLLQLSSVGLGNFILSQLSLAWAGDTEAVCGLLLRCLTSLRPSQLSCQHSAQVWAGLVALLLLQLQKGVPMDPVVGQVGRLLTELAASCTSTASHVSGPLHSAVEVVMRGTVELYRFNTLPVSAAHQALLSEPLCQSVRCLVERGKLVRVLEWVQSVIGAIGQHCVWVKEGRRTAEERTRIQESLTVLFRHLLPIMSTQAQSPLPPAQLMGCATELVSLCNRHSECELVSGESSAYLQLVVEEFAFHDSVAPSFCAEFLVHLLKGEGQEAWLSTEHAQLRVLHSWLRCLVQMHHPPGATQPVQTLTQLVCKLPLVTRLMAGSSDDSAARVHPLQLLRELASGINKEMIKSPSLAEKTAWFQRGAVLFGDLMKCMEPGLSGDFPPKAMEMCYKVSGCLVRNCPRVIYRRSESRCLLPRLVDQLLVPVSNPRRPAHSNTSANVKRSLHHFIWGLLQLDPQSDEFIKRKIKQIFGKYFLAFCQQSQPTPLMKRTDSNPFLTLLTPCFEDHPTKEDVNTLLFILELIAAQQLKTPHQQLTHLSLVLTFLHTVFSQVRHAEALARCTLVVFQPLLTCMRLCHLQPSTPELNQISKLCLDNVKLLLVACDKSEGLVQSSELTAIMGDYVSSNISNNVILVFKPIQALIPFACDLVSDFQPVAWDLVERAEMGRGNKKDRFLREAYQSLVEDISLHQK